MTFSSKYFYALASMLASSSCVEHHPPPISPPYPFEVGKYSIFVDEEQGDYDIIPVGDRKYCIYSKKMDDGDDIFIHDYNCDNHGERVVILSKENKIIRADDFKRLPKITTQYLDYILQNSKKHILNSDTIIF